MRPLFINSAYVFTKEKLLLKNGSWQAIRLKVRYGLIKHPKKGLILIDTGYGNHVTSNNNRSLPLRIYNKILQVQLNDDYCAENYIQSMGYTLDDVKIVIITHFHPDHISQLKCFKNAQFIASSSAWERFKNKSNFFNIRHGVFRELVPDDFDQRLLPIERFLKKRASFNLGKGWDILEDQSLLAIDLPGHAKGHFGLCFENLDTPLLYAVDTQWLEAAIMENLAPMILNTLIANNLSDLQRSILKVLEFKKSGGNVLLCHDPISSHYDL